MRGIFLGAVMLGLVVGVSVAGARIVMGGSESSPDETATNLRSPQAAAEAFAHAWTAGDFPALYVLLDPATQQATTLEQFTQAYNSFATETTQAQISASVQSASVASATLAVRLATAYFGTLEYTIALNLVPTSAGWSVSWSPAAIHPELTDGRTFKSDIQRPTRGAILDRNGAQLAVTKDIRFLGLNRSTVTNRAALTSALVDFGFTKDQVDAAFNDSSGPTQRVRVGVVPDEKAEAAATILRNIPGVLLFFESQRVHPLGPAAAHVVGYTRELTAEELAARPGQGYRPGDRVGAIGLEASQDEVLAGKIGAELRIVDGDGATPVRVVASRAFVPGQDVRATLDSATLRAAYVRLGTRAGAAVVLDPRTNAILALNSSPSFDPDAFERNDAEALKAITSAAGGPQANRATTGLYSGGSTFKLVTGAAGLAFGGYKPKDLFECGAVWYGLVPPRRNWEGGQGQLTIAEGLMRSCNSVFYQIGLTLYNNTDGALSKMARLFGYGASSGVVGLSDEEGLVPDAAWKRATRNEAWFPGDEVNLAIGQGDLLITPLQLANAYSTLIANDLRAPVILAGQPATSRGALPLTPEQSAHLKLGLALVTGIHGTASAAFALSGYTDFLGKSGTAEDAGAQQHVLFVAAAPAAAPRAVAAVVLDDGQSGSIEAGPIARDIVLTAIK